MMKFISLTLASILALSSSASPLPEAQTLAYNFTLAAINLTLPNTNTTGVPLVLGADGAIQGAQFEVASTYNSFPYNGFPSLYLSGSSLQACRADGVCLTKATTLASSVNAPVSWITTSVPSLSEGKVSFRYTAVQESSSTFAQLAVEGRTDAWSLCLFAPEFDERVGKVNLVYNVDYSGKSVATGFNVEDCHTVRVNLVPK